MERTAVDVSNDRLTGMLTRAGFRSLLQGHGTDYAVLHLDIDQFTQVNVLFGEQVADALLCRMAERLQQYAGGAGQCARLGSDEFALLLPAIDTDDALEICCVDLMTFLQQPVVLGDVTLHPQVAVGAARVEPTNTARSDEPVQVLRHAHIALQQARFQDYPRFSIFNAVQRHIWENRAYIELQLLNAIHNGDLSVAYQPIVDVVSGKIEGFEALARWILPDGRSSSPAQFIPIAERNGSIIALGKRIFSVAIRDFAAMTSALQAPLKLHINVSARQLADPALCNDLLQLLDIYGVSPAQLVVELTESHVAQHFDSMVSVIRNIKSAGMGVALDDFGTGFSSLSYIASLTLDVIKIDRSFLINAHDNDEALCIMRAIVAMAQSLGIRTVAEGVELPAHVALIKREGCNYLQGYFAGRPMTMAQCQQLLREKSLLATVRDIRPQEMRPQGRFNLDQCPMHCRNCGMGN